MRNPERLDTFYDDMKKLHKEYFCDLRFGQLMCIFFGWLVSSQGRDPFFPEETEMMDKFKEYCESFRRSS